MEIAAKTIAAAEFIRPILNARDIAFPLQLCGPNSPSLDFPM